MEKAIIDLAAQSAKRTHGSMFLGHPGGFGYFLGPLGPVRLESSRWTKVLDRAFGTALNRIERKAEPLDDEARRLFLSATGWLCDEGQGRLCPACVEARMLAPLGAATITEVAAR